LNKKGNSGHWTIVSFAKMAGDEVSHITLAGFFEASGLLS
jgi:hypothetical protein